jgi:hypothetical protein
MEKLVYKGRYLELYDSIEEMPITVFQDFNRYLLIDAGVGGDIESIDTHLARLNQYFAKKDAQNFTKQIRNLRQNLAFVISRTSPRMLSFAALVHSVNGIPVKDRTDSGYQKLVERLGKKGIPYGLILKATDDVKKKLKGKLPFIFRKTPTTAGNGNF